MGIIVATVRKTMSSTIKASEQAEQFLHALLDWRELGVAVELDDHPCRLDLLADGVLTATTASRSSRAPIVSLNCASA